MKTASELLKCAERELAMRLRVYPDWVANGRMTSQKSDHEIECMAQITDQLREQARKEDPQQDLFTE